MLGRPFPPHPEVLQWPIPATSSPTLFSLPRAWVFAWRGLSVCLSVCRCCQTSLKTRALIFAPRTQPGLSQAVRREWGDEWALPILPSRGFRDFSKYLYTCLGLAIAPEMSSTASPAPTVRILIHPLGDGDAGTEEGAGGTWETRGPGLSLCSSPVPAHREGEIVRHMGLRPHSPVVLSERAGGAWGSAWKPWLCKAMSPSAVSSLLRSTFPPEKVHSVREDVTAPEEVQSHRSRLR